MPGTVHYDLTDHIATITLDNPKARNAFDYEMTQELRRLWNEIEANPEVRCVIVTGGGREGLLHRVGYLFHRDRRQPEIREGRAQGCAV